MTGVQTAPKRTLKRSLHLAASSLAMNLRCMRGLSVFIGIAGFGMALWPNLISRLYAALTDDIQGIFAQAETVSSASWLLLLLVGAYLIQAAYDYAYEVTSARDTQAITKHIKSSIMTCAGSVAFRYINNDADFRDRMSFTEMFGASEVATSVQQVLVTAQHLVAAISMAVLLWTVSPWIVFSLLLATIPSLLISASQREEDYKSKTKHMKNSAMSVHLFYMAAGANERCKSLLDLRFNNFFPWIKERWRKVSALYLDEKRAVTKKYVALNMIADVLRYGVFIVVLLIAAGRVFESPALGIGTFTLVLTLSQQLQSRLSRLLASTLTFYASINYIEDYQILLATPQEALHSAQIDLSGGDIVYDRVTFAYPGGQRPALSNVSVRIRKGEKIAIVGENGSGKSTFVNLLCGLYEPTEGAVTLSGIQIGSALASVRDALAFVPQNFGRYEASIRDNVTIAQPERAVTDGELRALAEAVDAWPFIEAEPRGLDEMIGTFSETGNNLSGGQWQKLALMRALYRKDAGIVILDEPTAALDPAAEATLYRSFRNLTGDRTTLLISHRLGICTTVDRILVFEDGCLVEDGSHEALMRQNGAYARLYRAQAQWYA